MFENIGVKIKGLARFLAWVGIIASVVAGIKMGSSGAAIGEYADSEVFADMGWIAGAIVIVVGSILSWVGSFLLYGFGQLVENSDYIREKVRNDSYFRQLIGNSDQMKKMLNEMLNEYRIAQYKNDVARAANNSQGDNASVPNDKNSEA